MTKKVYYAIKNKEGKFLADYEDGKYVYKSSRYYLYDLRVAKQQFSNLDNNKELEIVISPVQDDSVWNDPNPYENKKK